MELRSHESARSDVVSGKKFSGRAPLLDMQKASARIVMVFCDTHFDRASSLVKDMRATPWATEDGDKDSHNLSSDLEPIKFSQMLKFTGETKADMLLINTLYPDTILGKMAQILSILTEFRNSNPNSPIVIANLYSRHHRHGAFLYDLEARGIAKVVEAPITYQRMVEAGTETLERS
jgi:hypothetical protein